MIISMPKIVVKMIVLVFQCVKRVIFDSPVNSPSLHDLINIVIGYGDVGNPAKVLLFSFFIRFPIL